MYKEFLENNPAKNFKVIIFDFDETMYYSPTARDWYISYIKTAVMRLGNKSEQEALRLMTEVGFTKENKSSPSFSGSLNQFGITRAQWDEYRIDNFFQVDYANSVVAPNEFYRDLSKKYKLYIVSTEVLENIQTKASRLRIDLSAFTGIYAPTRGDAGKAPKKAEQYRKILQENGCKAHEMLIVGDRLKVDIEPMLELGGCGLQVTEPREYVHFFGSF